MPAILTSVKNKITRELKLKKASFSYPPNSDLGDLSLACFELAKENKKNPAALAGELAEKLKNSSRLKNIFPT